MNTNKYFKLWLPITGIHALHQIEESISFFPWYADNMNHIPHWLLISSHIAKIAIAQPEIFILASFTQLSCVALTAFLFRHHEQATKYLLLFYILGLAFFFIWHILTSYFAHSYAPIMVTCFMGLYLIPFWLAKINKLNKATTTSD